MRERLSKHGLLSSAAWVPAFAGTTDKLGLGIHSRISRMLTAYTAGLFRANEKSARAGRSHMEIEVLGMMTSPADAAIGVSGSRGPAGVVHRHPAASAPFQPSVFNPTGATNTPPKFRSRQRSSQRGPRLRPLCAPGIWYPTPPMSGDSSRHRSL